MTAALVDHLLEGRLGRRAVSPLSESARGDSRLFGLVEHEQAAGPEMRGQRDAITVSHAQLHRPDRGFMERVVATLGGGIELPQ